MTVRRGSLYLGVFLVGAGAVTLLVAGGALDRDAVATAVGTLWPLAVIAIGVGLVLRRSPIAIPAGIVAALVPGIALGASVAAAPVVAVPCTSGNVPAGTPVTRDGVFATAATVDLSLSCGEIHVTTQPGTSWRIEARDGRDRRTDVSSDTGRLAVDTGNGSRRFGLGAGGVGVDVVLPTGSSLDLATEVNAGRGRLALDGARLGGLGLDVNAGDLRADLTGASLERLTVEVNAGSAGIVLPADSFEGRLATNAGSLALCVPDQLGLRVRSSASLGSVDTGGLVLRGSAWESPAYATAPFKADLAIDASLGSVTINPEGGCK